MDRIGEFLNMGGHAAYIWPSYALTFGVLIILLVVSLRALRRAEADLEQLEGSRRPPQLNEGEAPTGGKTE